MAAPAAILSILVEAQTGQAATRLRGMQAQLEATGAHVTGFGTRTTAMSKEVERGTRRAHASFSNMAKGVIAAGGAFAAFEAAKNAVKSTLDLAHATERLTAITGMDAKTASSWIEIMKVRGAQSKQVNMMFITLSRNMRNAQDGSKAAATAFKQLGIPLTELKNQRPDQALKLVADGLRNIKSPAERAALAQQLFGRGAQALIPVLAQGRQGIDAALAAANRYGAFLPNNVKRLEGARDAQRNLNLAMDGMKISFTEAVLPSLVAGAGKLMTFIQQMRQGRGAGGEFASAVSSAFNTLKSVVTSVVGAVGGLGNTVRLLIAAFVVSKVVAFAGALKAMFLLVRASPLGAFLTVVGLLTAAFTLLSPKQTLVARTAREVADAWNAARDAARGLRDAHIALTQAKLDLITATKNERAAQDSANAAVRRYGRDSPQARDATLQLRQANLNLTQAQNRVHDSAQDISTAQVKSRDATEAAVKADRERAQTLAVEYNKMVQAGASSNALKAKMGQFNLAVAQLNRDQDSLNRSIGNMPKDVQSKVAVNLSFGSNIAGAISGIASSIGSGIGRVAGIGGGQATSSSGIGHRATGGLVNQPGYFAGEEAPRHPEVILATNPKYRQRNLGLWQKAGSMLGIPGFQAGGLVSPAREIGAVDPWAARRGAEWIRGRATTWAKNKIGALGGALGGGALGGGAIGGSSAANQTLGRAMMLAAGWGIDQWPSLQALWMQESGWNANAVNSSSGAYGIPQSLGHGHPFNLGDAGAQIAWGLNYIRSVYGSPSAAEAHERAFNWYRKGGIHGYKAGGINYYGHPSNVNPYVSQLIGLMEGKYPSLAVTSTTDGTHARGSYHYRGAAVDMASDAATMLNAANYIRSSGLYSSLAEGIHNPNLSVKYGKFVSPGYWGASTWAEHANHIHMAITSALANVTSRITTSGGGGGGGGGGHYPTGAVFGPKLNLFKHHLRHPSGGAGLTGTKGLNSRQKRALTWQQRLLGQPRLPHLKGTSSQTLAGAAGIAGRIAGGRSLIDTLTHKEGTLETFFGLNPPALVDDNGIVNEKARKTLLAQNQMLIDLRQRIFNAWQFVIVRTQRLIASYKLILKRLRTGLASIKTSGLKGAALTAAQKRQTNTRDLISKVGGKLSSARGDLTSAFSDRDQAWLDLLTLHGARSTITGTKSSPSSTSADAGAADNSATVALLQTLLSQANMRTAVSQAQYGVLKSGGLFAGAFQAGGTLSRAGWALVGERGPELAHLPGGTHVYPNTQSTSSGGTSVIHVVIQDGAVDPNKIKVIAGNEAQVVLRREIRAGTRNLAGRGGGVIRG